MKTPIVNLEDKMPTYDVMRRVLEMDNQKKLMESVHWCVDCTHFKNGGCENCDHDYRQLPDCGEKCIDCEMRFP